MYLYSLSIFSKDVTSYNAANNKLERIDDDIKSNSDYVDINVDSSCEYAVVGEVKQSINQNILIPTLIIIIIIGYIVKKKKVKVKK